MKSTDQPIARSSSRVDFSARGDLTQPNATRLPAPALFNATFYCQQSPDVDGTAGDLWTHFCTTGFVENKSPHPLFDTKFYREQYLSGEANVNPLLHYLSEPDNRRNTHPLLDVEFYISQLSAEQYSDKPAGQTWMEYFLKQNLHDLKSASLEFSAARYVKHFPEVARQGVNPLCHYLSRRVRKRGEIFRDLQVRSRLFDERYYLQSNPDLQASGVDAWTHFCEHGFRENRCPNPVFHTKFYRQKYLSDAPEINPLSHYEDQTDFQTDRLLDTHPLFDSSFYVSQIKETFEELGAAGVTPLEHFLKYNRDNLASPSPLFSSQRYLEYHRDIAACKANPLYHFLVHGQGGKRQSFVDLENLKLLRFRDEYELEQMAAFQVAHQDFIVSMANTPLKRTIVCVSHEASMTGAPLIILKIAEMLHAQYGFDIVNVLCRGGELQSKFELLGPTIVLDGTAPYREGEKFWRSMQLFHELMADANALGALVNSAESRHMLPELKKLQIPVHSLVHENARCYPAGEFAAIAEHSDRVIFPSNYVLQPALENTTFDEDQTEILPQGLLNEPLLEIDVVDSTNEVRERFGIPADATLVLGCGTQDGRKGLDLFISTAIIALDRCPKGSLYFGWLGGRNNHDNVGHAFWADRDLETAGVTEYVKFLGQTDNVIPFFQAADCLFLSSRMDPFPCVVNEAMASAKPIVLFDSGSGCVDLIGADGGIAVPYGNVAKAADAVLELAKYPRLRSQMGDRNRTFVRQQMSYDRYVKTLVDGLVASMGSSQYGLRDVDVYQELCRQLAGTNGKRKIIFALPAWNVSGVNTFVENLIVELRDQGYDASILFTSRDSAKVELENMPSVPYRYLTSRTVDAAERRQRMRDYLELNAPCVFVPNYDYIASSIAPQLPATVGVLGVLHCDDDEHYLHGYQLGHYWDAMVAVSQTIEDKMLRLNPGFADRMSTIRYGIPVNHDLDRNRAGRTSTIRIIYTGRMVQEQKRIRDFVKLTRALESQKVPFELTFVGDGAELGWMQRQLQELTEAKAVKFLGRQSPSQVAEQLKSHDILVLTSEFEGLPLSLLEAMSFQCVPVVTDIKSGISEVLSHRENSMLSPVGDMETMAAHIAALHQDRELLRTLGQNAYHTLFSAELTAKQMAQKYITVLDSMFDKLNRGDQLADVPLDCPAVNQMLNVA